MFRRKIVIICLRKGFIRSGRCGKRDEMNDTEDHKTAVRIARAVIERKLGKDNVSIPEMPQSFKKKAGIFVTLNRFPGRDLRGCIGYPEPVMELQDALKEASISAATRDNRFPRVSLLEMDSIVIDVTILTPPRKIEYDSIEELISKVKIGRDGLIARKRFMSGLLLPQVPVEWDWGIEEFLSHTCMKAGLSPDEWKTGTVEFMSFSGKVFGEVEPGGEIKEEKLS
jgi:hypothetical protein